MAASPHNSQTLDKVIVYRILKTDESEDTREALLPYEYEDGTCFDLEKNNSTKKFIKLHTNVIRQYKDLGNNLDEDKISSVKKIFSETCSNLLSLSPHKISAEYTYENSLMFTIIRGSYTCFYERFLDNPNEVIYSCYKDDMKLPSYEGDFSESFISIKQDLKIQSEINPFTDNNSHLYINNELSCRNSTPIRESVY